MAIATDTVDQSSAWSVDMIFDSEVLNHSPGNQVVSSWMSGRCTYDVVGSQFVILFIDDVKLPLYIIL